MMATLVLGMLLVLTVGEARAAVPGPGAEAHGVPWKDILIHAVNLGILLGALYYFGKKPFLQFVRQRKEAMDAAIDEARRAREEAQQRFAAMEQRLQRVRDDAEALVARLVVEGRAERDRAITAAARAAERLREEAHVIAEQEVRKAERLLRAEAADLALDLALRRVAADITDADHERLAEEFIAGVRGVA